jgi:uncharacterized protein (TIGR00251 family)
MSWLQTTSKGIMLNVRVVPRAAKTEAAGMMGDELRIRLNAPPVDGKANKALLEFLADTLDLSRRQIELVAGEHDRRKRILITGCPATVIQKKLNP